MAGREEESLDVEIVVKELDEDCLVRVGRAGAGGAGADAPNPAQKEALESQGLESRLIRSWSAYACPRLAGRGLIWRLSWCPKSSDKHATCATRTGAWQ